MPRPLKLRQSVAFRSLICITASSMKMSLRTTECFSLIPKSHSSIFLLNAVKHAA